MNRSLSESDDKNKNQKSTPAKPNNLDATTSNRTEVDNKIIARTFESEALRLYEAAVRASELPKSAIPQHEPRGCSMERLSSDKDIRDRAIHTERISDAGTPPLAKDPARILSFRPRNRDTRAR